MLAAPNRFDRHFQLGQATQALLDEIPLQIQLQRRRGVLQAAATAALSEDARGLLTLWVGLRDLDQVSLQMPLGAAPHPGLNRFTRQRSCNEDRGLIPTADALAVMAEASDLHRDGCTQLHLVDTHHPLAVLL